MKIKLFLDFSCCLVLQIQLILNYLQKNKVLKLFHLLSLDVVVGTVISSKMFWKLPFGNSQVNMPSLIILAAATWAIYILDRILDIRISTENLTIRHQFHHTNRKTLVLLAIILIIICFIEVFFLPKRIILNGIILGGLIIIYFLILNLKLYNIHYQWIKEPVTSFFYTSAVAGIPIFRNPQIGNVDYGLVIIFGIIVLINLVLFSYFEYLQKPKSINLCSKLDISGSKKLIFLLFIIGFSASFSLLFFANHYQQKVIFIKILMQLTLLFIFIKHKSFLENEKYRWLADGVFLLPLLLEI